MQSKLSEKVEEIKKIIKKKTKTIDIVSEIEDVLDASTDVIVNLEDDHTYVVGVSTLTYLLRLMEYDESEFLSPGDPVIVVKKLTEEVIQKAIEAYAEENEAYYLKFYAAHLDVKTLNVLRDRKIARSNLLEKGESIDIENYSLIDFNINNNSNNNLG